MPATITNKDGSLPNTAFGSHSDNTIILAHHLTKNSHSQSVSASVAAYYIIAGMKATSQELRAVMQDSADPFKGYNIRMGYA